MSVGRSGARRQQRRQQTTRHSRHGAIARGRAATQGAARPADDRVCRVVRAHGADEEATVWPHPASRQPALPQQQLQVREVRGADAAPDAGKGRLTFVSGTNDDNNIMLGRKKRSQNSKPLSSRLSSKGEQTPPCLILIG